MYMYGTLSVMKVSIQTEEQRKQLKPLSYIVIVVDEVADLMVTYGNEV